MDNQNLQRKPDGRQTPEEQQLMVDALAQALLQAASKTAAPQPSQPQKEPKTIDLVELFFRLLSKVHFIILAALIGAIYMGMQASNSVTVYSATSKLYIVGSQGATINISDLQLGNLLTMDYTEVFRTWEVHEMVRSQLGLNYSYSQLQGMISVSNPPDTRVLYITARSTNPQLAADVANAYASAAKTFILQTMDGEAPNLFSVALVPSSGSSVSRSSYAMRGFMLGGVLATGVFVLLFVLDDRPRTPQDLQKLTGAPTLAVVPILQQKKASARQKGGRK